MIKKREVWRGVQMWGAAAVGDGIHGCAEGRSAEQSGERGDRRNLSLFVEKRPPGRKRTAGTGK